MSRKQCICMKQPIQSGDKPTIRRQRHEVQVDRAVAMLRLLPPDAKIEMEREAMGSVLDNVEFGPRLMALWEELHEHLTAEARLVHDADKLDKLSGIAFDGQGNLYTASRKTMEVYRAAAGTTALETLAGPFTDSPECL